MLLLKFVVPSRSTVTAVGATLYTMDASAVPVDAYAEAEGVHDTEKLVPGLETTVTL